MGLFTTPEGNKTHLARAIAAFGLGPFLIAASVKGHSPASKIGLLLSGLSTTLYNAINLYTLQRQAPTGSAQGGQPIRLIDIFLMGPFLIWAGYNMEDRALKAIVMAAGVGTIIFNANNYIVAAT